MGDLGSTNLGAASAAPLWLNHDNDHELGEVLLQQDRQTPILFDSPAYDNFLRDSLILCGRRMLGNPLLYTRQGPYFSIFWGLFSRTLPLSRR